MNKRVFIGYTSYQDILFKVAKYSFQKFSPNLDCFPIKQDYLRELGAYNRPPDKLGTTEFSLTRFLTPWLAGYKGWALFTDNDVLALDDVNKLFDFADEKYAVICAKHQYQPSDQTKLDNQIQTLYPRKNWSSVVLWNCGHKKNLQLTPEYIDAATPMELHRFLWLDDKDIGEFSHEWNWLVDWYKEPKDGSPKLLHYTEGGPYFKSYQNCDFAENWLKIYKEYTGKEFTEKDIIDL